MSANGSTNGNGGESQDSRISYTIRELLQRMDGKLDGVISRLDAKAERSEVELLRTRVAEIQTARQAERDYGTALLAEYRKGQDTQALHGQRLTILETQAATKRQLYAAWIPSLISLAGLAVVIVLKYH